MACTDDLRLSNLHLSTSEGPDLCNRRLSLPANPEVEPGVCQQAAGAVAANSETN